MRGKKLTAEEMCGTYMPRANTNCALGRGHRGKHMTPKAVADKAARTEAWARENRSSYNRRRYREAHPDAREWERFTDTTAKQWWRQIIDAHKVMQGCAVCGFQSNRANYFDLDHVDPAMKTENISELIGRLHPNAPGHVGQFLAEIRKCQVLCVACHRDKTKDDLSKMWEGAT